MPASVAGDISMGHAFSPSGITPVTSTVIVGGKIPHAVGDVIGVHVLGLSAHAGTIAQASTTVYWQNKGAARLMDGGDCGAILLGTQGNVLIGG